MEAHRGCAIKGLNHRPVCDRRSGGTRTPRIRESTPGDNRLGAERADNDGNLRRKKRQMF